MENKLDFEKLTVLRVYSCICSDCLQFSEFIVFLDSDNCCYHYCSQCSSCIDD